MNEVVEKKKKVVLTYLFEKFRSYCNDYPIRVVVVEKLPGNFELLNFEVEFNIAFTTVH